MTLVQASCQAFNKAIERPADRFRQRRSCEHVVRGRIHERDEVLTQRPMFFDGVTRRYLQTYSVILIQREHCCVQAYTLKVVTVRQRLPYLAENQFLSRERQKALVQRFEVPDRQVRRQAGRRLGVTEVRQELEQPLHEKLAGSSELGCPSADLITEVHGSFVAFSRSLHRRSARKGSVHRLKAGLLCGDGMMIERQVDIDVKRA